ncbi:MAG: bestrophin family protein [Bacteroidetes bacterium]|nr:bestrophin family protein [Bacteroidota bacterium]
MRSYDTKNWFSVLTFYRHDTARTLWPVILFTGIYTFGVVYFIDNSEALKESNVIKNIFVIHSLLGFVISMLLVFRTNTAYDRWWEGRKLWGSLVNSSRNLAIRLHSILDKDDQTNRQYFTTFISLFPRALDQHLKSKALQLSLDENEHPELAKLDPEKHLPFQISAMIQSKIYSLHRENKIGEAPLITLSNEMASFMDICGACERIKNTPIPYSYASFIKKFIILYILSLPWGLNHILSYWSIAVVIFVMYALSSLEVIAEEIEEPFGEDANDLPTGKIADNIGKNVREILM